jgi:hypothetical protein
MAEQDTSPDEEMTPEAMAEEADEMLKVMRWLKYGQGQRFLELLGGTVHELRTFLERGLDREEVIEMAFDSLLIMARKSEQELEMPVIHRLRSAAEELVQALEQELEAEG